MPASNFNLTVRDGTTIVCYSWLPSGVPKAVVQIAHGLAEHAGRYARLAQALNAAGYAVYANDHRGHGRTASSERELGWLARRDGWSKCIGDLNELNRRIAAQHPGVPIVLLGHSMGATLALDNVSRHGDSLAGVVLSGASGQPTAFAAVGKLIARLERMRIGAPGHSALVNALTFGGFNKPFAPTRTEFDWLSRDSAEVDKYVADPLCGFPCSVQLWIDLLGGWTAASSSRSLGRIPKELPIYVISGGKDPVGGNCRQVEAMLKAFADAGLNKVEHKFYPEARHEIFNETNRDEVTRDLLAWLERAVPVRQEKCLDTNLRHR
jgi:alpha-beta hydrolase superfamily lysophospholipase